MYKIHLVKGGVLNISGFITRGMKNIIYCMNPLLLVGAFTRWKHERGDGRKE